MTLEESIRFHTEEAGKLELHPEINKFILGIEGYERAKEEHTQTAEWLRELQARRKQPERKVGKWTEDNACEFCGFKPWYERDIHTLSYCPNCGADMRGEQYE